MNPWIGLGAAALLVFVGVPALFLAGSPWKWSELDPETKRRIGRASLGAGALFASVGAVLGAILAAITENAIVTFVGTVAFAGALSVWSLRAAAPIATIKRLGERLHFPTQRESARAELLELTAKLPNDATGATLRISAATVLSNAGFDGDALVLVEKLDESGFDQHSRDLRKMLMFSAQVSTRQLEAARSTLAELPQFAEDDQHSIAKRVITARLLVLEGKPDEAVALIRQPCERIESERGRRVVLAHAYAALQDNAALEATLDWLAGQPRGLDRVISPEGPATPHAMARVQKSPYGR